MCHLSFAGYGALSELAYTNGQMCATALCTSHGSCGRALTPAAHGLFVSCVGSWRDASESFPDRVHPLLILWLLEVMTCGTLRLCVIMRCNLMDCGLVFLKKITLFSGSCATSFCFSGWQRGGW